MRLLGGGMTADWAGGRGVGLGKRREDKSLEILTVASEKKVVTI